MSYSTSKTCTHVCGLFGSDQLLVPVAFIIVQFAMIADLGGISFNDFTSRIMAFHVQ